MSRLGAVRPREALRTKSGAAGLSILSNSVLIALKLAAGAITGSIAIITEAVHSSIDLVASIIAFVSVRAASEPADADHPYGHERVENLAAVIEGMLIVIGAGIIIFEATDRLVDPPGEIDALAVGIAVAAFSTLANVVVSTFLFRRARELRSPALEADAAHLQTDAMTSAGLLVGLGLVEVTGVVEFDAITALLIAVAIVAAGIRILSRSSRILVDEAPPPEELDRIEQAIASAGMPEVAGYHKLRARRSGSHRHIDLHVQFRSGTTLERAHELAHELRGAIEEAIPYSDVLIHVEPESSVTDDHEDDQPLRHGRL